jgi:2-dehydro-3-deoxyphosphogluconate aldolase / (4S)-4-hydroxy-2-oxoglutarate aldolase
MDKRATLLKLIPEQGILPLYFYKDTDVSIEVLRALYHAGIRAVEYTNRGEAALKNFIRMQQVRDSELKDMYLGIGTVKDGTTAQSFVDAGTDFIVCPGLVKSVAEVAEKYNMLWIPGCMTPTEIIQAEQSGAKLVKLFPGSLLGPGFVSAIKELFPALLFMPTGGVDITEENLSGWFKAGVCAVGMGSKLVSKSLLEKKAYTEITELTKQVIKEIQSIQMKLKS